MSIAGSTAQPMNSFWNGLSFIPSPYTEYTIRRFPRSNRFDGRVPLPLRLCVGAVLAWIRRAYGCAFTTKLRIVPRHSLIAPRHHDALACALVKLYVFLFVSNHRSPSNDLIGVSRTVSLYTRDTGHGPTLACPGHAGHGGTRDTLGEFSRYIMVAFAVFGLHHQPRINEFV